MASASMVLFRKDSVIVPYNEIKCAEYVQSVMEYRSDFSNSFDGLVRLREILWWHMHRGGFVRLQHLFAYEEGRRINKIAARFMPR